MYVLVVKSFVTRKVCFQFHSFLESIYVVVDMACVDRLETRTNKLVLRNEDVPENKGFNFGNCVESKTDEQNQQHSQMKNIRVVHQQYG